MSDPETRGTRSRPPTEGTFVTHAGASLQPLVGARVRIVEGPDRGFEMVLPPAGVVVGNSADCNLRLTDRHVSRTHLQIVPEGDRFRVRDLGSSNGTFVDGVRLHDALVTTGSTLKLGKSALRLVGPEEYAVAAVSRQAAFGELLGTSVAMRQVFGVLELAAASSVPVLLEGETGTGKEVAASSLHALGARKKGPFVVVDCSAIAPNLIESELFGHVRGAFTGAVETRAGAFERAHGGTLFLDELGELALDLQPKLLRVLETREVRKVGGGEAQRVDLRIIAGTNRRLGELVAAKTFRSDLYYRLAVMCVALPPLRARLDDLPVLVEKFLREGGVEAPGRISGANLELLRSHSWPGNVRELRNVVQRALAYAGSNEVTFHKLPLEQALGRQLPPGADAARLDVPFHLAKERVVEAFEYSYLSALVSATEGNVTEASRRSGINRRHLYDLMSKHGLKK